MIIAVHTACGAVYYRDAELPLPSRLVVPLVYYVSTAGHEVPVAMPSKLRREFVHGAPYGHYFEVLGYYQDNNFANAPKLGPWLGDAPGP